MSLIAEDQENRPRLPGLQLHLVNSSASALHIGEAVASVTDAITKRLIEMAEAKLGAAPVPYAWMAGGSQAPDQRHVGVAVVRHRHLVEASGLIEGHPLDEMTN